MSTDYPDFDGFAVTERNGRLLITKPHPRAKGGQIVVKGFGADLGVVYLAAKRDALAAALALAEGDEVDGALMAYHAADRAVLVAKVKRGLAKGFGEDYAVKRLREAGLSFADIAAELGG